MDTEERERVIKKLRRTEKKMVKDNAKRETIKKIKRARRRLEEVEQER